MCAWPSPRLPCPTDASLARGPGVEIDVSFASAESGCAPWRSTASRSHCRAHRELERAVFVEGDTRTDHQVTNGARHQDLPRTGLAENSRRDMHRQAADVIVDQFALAGVYADTDLDPQQSRPAGTATRHTGWPVSDRRMSRGVRRRCSSPPCRRRFRRGSSVISSNRCSIARHRSSPVAAARSVDATMSVNSTVRSARCDCGGARWLPVRNSSMALRILSGSVIPRRMVASLDLQHLRARNVIGEVVAELHRHRVVPCVNHRVGAVMLDSNGRISSRRNDVYRRANHSRARAHSLEHSQLPADRADGNIDFTVSPVPHCVKPARVIACNAAIWLTVGMYLPSSRPRREARAHLGRVLDRRRPDRPESTSTSRRGSTPSVRSGRFAAKTAEAGPPSLIPKTTASVEADGVHHGLDLRDSIIQRAHLRDRVRQPEAGLVEHHDATEAAQLLEEGLEVGKSPEQFDMADHRPA